MPFAFFEGEKSIEELIHRIFRPQGTAPPPAVPKAAAEILNANPHLHDLSSVARGAVIVIPETAPPVHPDELATSPPTALAAASQRAAARIRILFQAIQVADSLATEKLKSIAAIAKTAAPSSSPVADASEDQFAFGKRPNPPSAADIQQRVAHMEKAQGERHSVFAATLKQIKSVGTLE